MTSATEGITSYAGATGTTGGASGIGGAGGASTTSNTVLSVNPDPSSPAVANPGGMPPTPANTGIQADDEGRAVSGSGIPAGSFEQERKS